MTKRAALTRYVAAALGATALCILVDLALVEAGMAWLAWIVDVAFAVGLVLVTWASFTPNAPLFGRVVDGQGVAAPVVAITFDDGPSPDTTPRILDALRREGVPATFFVLGKHVERHPAIVEQMVRDGHEVASHGYDHGILTFARRRDIHAQLSRTDALLRRLGVPPVRLFRAPHGFRNPIVCRTARRLGFRTAGWTKGVFDTALPGPDVIVERSKRALRPGAILLLHDADGNGDGDRSQTAEALPAILDAVRHAGLRPVRLSELERLQPARAVSWKRLAVVALAIAAVVTLGLERIERHEVEQTWSVFRNLSVPLVIAALLANLASVFFKAVVWKASLDTLPRVRRFRYADVVPAIFIGFLLNTVLIARLGEVGRMFVLQRAMRKRASDVPLPAIAGTVVTEQLVLGVTLALMLFVMAVTVDGVPSTAVSSVYVLLVVVAVLTVGVFLLEAWARYRRRRGRVVEREGARTWWVALLRNADALIQSVGQGQRMLRHPGRTAWSLVNGVVSWSAQLLGIYLTLWAFGIHEDRMAAAALVFLVSNLIGLLPVVPGNVGVFQIAVATTLSSSFGVNYTSAFAFAIGLQVIEVALGAGLGFVFLSVAGMSFGQVRRDIARVEAEAEEALLRPVPVADAPQRPVAA